MSMNDPVIICSCDNLFNYFFYNMLTQSVQ